ncbi:hypothetical protein MP228_007949 [Amoeboaphelidium protococcarum]|nr:hypothetical protein MP228_007949 [Amoeboaphelidium protococcarum]
MTLTHRPVVGVQSYNIDGFMPSKRDYGRQYASLYWSRLEIFRPLLLENIQSDSKLSRISLKQKISDVVQNEKCIIVGTCYLDMPLKPNVLTELAEENQIGIPSLAQVSYSSDRDVATLEDLSGRIVLQGDEVKKQLFVTGLVCALVGTERESGVFTVDSVIFSSLRDVPPLPAVIKEKPVYIALVSCLSMAGTSDYERSLLRDYICGNLLCNDSDVQDVSSISRLIIAGNSFAQNRQQLKDGDNMSFALSKFQQFLRELNQVVQVDVMPGACDPTTFLLPQKPIHKGMLLDQDMKRKGQMLENVHCRTNPCAFNVEGVKFLGTSGQNLDDLCHYVPLKEDGVSTTVDRLNIASRMLDWRHIAPSSPDTLCCYPYVDSDPFALIGGNQDGTLGVPNVFFIGNQPRFGTKLVEAKDGSGKCRVILVPEFASTHQIVLLNLQDLSVKTVEF